MTTCCFTGHRRIPPEVVAPLRERLEAEIESLIRQGVRYFGAGGALGFDPLAAEAVLEAAVQNLAPELEDGEELEP